MTADRPTPTPGIDVDAIAPLTPGLLRVAENRANRILREWARLHSVWGTTALHGPEDAPHEQAPTLRHLAIACYTQGARDAIAVAAHHASAPDESREGNGDA